MEINLISANQLRFLYFGLLIVTVQTYPGIPNVPEFLELPEIIGLTTEKEFDILILTQQWPQTICSTFESAKPCKLPPDNRWTIHGLWPTKLHTKEPAFCDNGAKFNHAAIASIEKELNEKWPSLNNKKSSRDFWTHEWKKHGTCSTMLKPVNTQENYFRKTLQLRDKFYVKSILDKLKILPGKSYPVKKIVDGINQALGKRCVVSLVCNSAKKLSYLSEIQICFDKSFNLIDCQGSIQYPKKCPRTHDIIYPDSPPAVYLDGLDEIEQSTNY
ncbi:ribonuclease Oy-like [Fopius arisanus]|uniref:Ribonuclease Oy-like n=2 Tax=Fopius arisanus TaxID=64838 RepID=A0A9R1UAZ3_9HYME|nr:PREDICTED: ribonuclease Oy-like [Fopius arisanus]